MKEKFTYLTIDENNKVPICFNLNVLEAIQEKYGSLKKWGAIVETTDDEIPQIKELKEGLLLMVNEAIEIENDKNSTNNPPIDSKKMGRIISQVGIDEVVKAIKKMTVESTTTDDEPKNE